MCSHRAAGRIVSGTCWGSSFPGSSLEARGSVCSHDPVAAAPQAFCAEPPDCTAAGIVMIPVPRVRHVLGSCEGTEISIWWFPILCDYCGTLACSPLSTWSPEAV